MSRILIGLAIGAAAMWLYDHWGQITGVIEHRDQIAGAQKVIEGLEQLGISL